MKINFKLFLCLFLSGIVFFNINILAQGVNSKEVIIALRNHLQDNPTDFDAQSKLALIYFNIGDYLKSEMEFLKIKALKGSPAYWLIPLARLYEMNNDAEKILNLIDGVDDNVVKNDTPWGQEVNVIRAQVFLSKNDIPKSKLYLEEILKVQPAHVEALWVLSKIQLFNNDIKMGQNTLSKAFENLKDQHDLVLSSKLYATQAEVDRLNKKIDKSKENYKKAINLNNNNLLAYLGLTTLYLEQNNKSEFIALANTFYELAPHYPKAIFFKGLVALEQKNKANAIVLLEKANQLDASDVGAQFVLAKIYYEDKQYERADVLFSSVVKNNPTYLPAVSFLATLKLKMNQPKATVKLISPFVNEQTKDYRLLALLGSANVISGDLEVGTSLLRRAAELQPENSSIKVDLALGYLANGKSDLAQKTLEQVVQSDSKLLQADVLLIYTAIGSNNFDKAKLTAENLIKKTPNNPVPYNLLGLSYMGLKNYELAKFNFEMAISKNKKFINAQNNLAEVYRIEKNYLKAKSVLLSSLDQDQNHITSLLMMARIMEQEDNKIDALAWLNKAEERNPKQAAAGIEKLKYYIRNKDNKLALSYAKQLLAKFPNNLVLKRFVEDEYAKL